MMSAPRSKSLPPVGNTGGAAADAEDEVMDFPDLATPPEREPTPEPNIPSWIQQLAAARSGRHSRASSVVSTRTRFSTTTFDDARSIDIQAGGQTFRISRHGDRITDATAPPPYSGPAEDVIVGQHPETFRPDGPRRDRDRLHHHGRPFRHNHEGPSHARGPRRVRIAMPDHDDNDSVMADTPSRELTDEEWRSILLELPSKLKHALGLDPGRVEPDAIGSSEYNPPSAVPSMETKEPDFEPSARDLMARVLPEDRSTGNSHVRGILRNAPHVAPHHTDAAMLEPGESRWTPYERTVGHGGSNIRQNFRRRSLDFQQPLPDQGVDQDPYASSDNTIPYREDDAAPPTVGDLNELSQVYNKVIRELDREHRRALHNRDKELESLRIQLNEKDIVYRQQLRGKDFLLDDYKRRLDRAEDDIESRVEHARHAVEDLWETRWREHQAELTKKLGLIRSEWQSYSTKGTQTDDRDESTGWG